LCAPRVGRKLHNREPLFAWRDSVCFLHRQQKHAGREKVATCKSAEKMKFRPLVQRIMGSEIVFVDLRHPRSSRCGKKSQPLIKSLNAIPRKTSLILRNPTHKHNNLEIRPIRWANV